MVASQEWGLPKQDMQNWRVSMSYTPTNWTTGDTITASAMNKIENGIANAGGYDLVILADMSNGHGLGLLEASDISVLQGDVLDCEEKIDNGEPVNAVLVLKGSWSYKPSTANTQYTAMYLPLTYWNAPYCLMMFGGVYGTTTTSTNVYVNLEYGYETGDIENVASGQRTI